MIHQEKFETQCADGVTLRGILLIPENPKAVVQFNCGTAAKKESYLKFLEYIAQHGYVCCLWDYRGSGESAPQNMRDCQFRFSDYGLKDMPAIKDFLNQRFPNLPYLLLAHSAGGQQIGFMHNLNEVKGAVNIAVSTGYYPNMPLNYRLKAYFFFYLFSPLSIQLTGWVRAKKFGFMEDLPREVVREWRSWCAERDFFFSPKYYQKTVPKGHYQEFDFPIHVFWTPDDTISNEKNTQNLWKHIRSDKGIEFTRVEPSALGVKQIGHFGFFRSSLKNQFWPNVVKQLDVFLA
ncbi:Predicted alpha/beta hydrolase [Flexibacter flexilis DSM 6793]|uniref:Predicted alpha/beta hydrolase n=1 Tax=Flexibacter flexilis DSM 6793 TaxID=927664 RepID=A0A1I1L4G8_9BACT|nr:alpha/beta fold hydrolase [Flexibacter flexilis]SFC67967.1 Predicted alpha/beta hydrolase [Flexibacter flexilis DSM 6793]